MYAGGSVTIKNRIFRSTDRMNCHVVDSEPQESSRLVPVPLSRHERPNNRALDSESRRQRFECC